MTPTRGRIVIFVPNSQDQMLLGGELEYPAMVVGVSSNGYCLDLQVFSNTDQGLIRKQYVVDEANAMVPAQSFWKWPERQ